MVDMGVKYLGQDRVVVCQLVPASRGFGIRCCRCKLLAALSFTEIIAFIHNHLITASRDSFLGYVKKHICVAEQATERFKLGR